MRALSDVSARAQGAYMDKPALKQALIDIGKLKPQQELTDIERIKQARAIVQEMTKAPAAKLGPLFQRAMRILDA